MKKILVSWNVNGLRAVCGKGFDKIFSGLDADFVCLQETKLSAGQLDLSFPGYSSHWNYAEKKGYSGTAVFTRHNVKALPHGIGREKHDHEGRVITLDCGAFYLVNVYVPNSRAELERLDYRMEWEEAFLEYILALDRVKPVVICGDLNVAHCEIDLKNPATNRKSAGFTDQERACFTRLLQHGFVDTFRYFNPDTEGAYTWWSYRAKARERNIGWRIDYFVVSERLVPHLVESEILAHITGSDHCPVRLVVDI